MDGTGSYSVAHRAGLLPTEFPDWHVMDLTEIPSPGQGSAPAPAPTKQRPGFHCVHFWVGRDHFAGRLRLIQIAVVKVTYLWGKKHAGVGPFVPNFHLKQMNLSCGDRKMAPPPN